LLNRTLTSPVRYFVAFALVCGALLLQLHSKLDLAEDRLAIGRGAAVSYQLPGPEILRMGALNHRTAASDLVWIHTIFYTAEQMIRRQTASDITLFADSLIALDPHFEPIYAWHNSTRMLVNRLPTHEDVAEANRILRTGLDYFPDNWWFARSIVANHLGNHFPRSPEQRLEDLEEAAHFARVGSQIPGAPPEMTLLATSFQRRVARARANLHEGGRDGDVEGSPEEIAFLIERYFSSHDQRTREFLHRRLVEIGAEEQVVSLTRVLGEQFESQHRRRFPYLSTNLCTAVDPELYLWDGFSIQGGSTQ
jgi:hypothetical protein